MVGISFDCNAKFSVCLFISYGVFVFYLYFIFRIGRDHMINNKKKKQKEELDEEMPEDLEDRPVSADLDLIDQEASGVNIQDAAGDDSPGSEEINTEMAPYQEPSTQGEQSVSGSMPDPTSDDDTQANAHGVGEQLGEDDEEENPEELDIARDIDEAEEYKRTH